MTATKQQLVYEQLRERILNGRYGPGFRVVIDTVAQEFSLSAPPIREALRRLEAEGLIVYRPNAGAHVASADAAALESELEVLAVLEGCATALAAPLLDAADRAQLEEINGEMRAALSTFDPLGFASLNDAFHAKITGRCPNMPMRSMVADVNRRMDAQRRTVFASIPFRAAESVREHDDLLSLLRTGGEPLTIELMAREHRLRTLASLRRWRQDGGVSKLSVEVRPAPR